MPTDSQAYSAIPAPAHVAVLSGSGRQLELIPFKSALSFIRMANFSKRKGRR